MRKLQLKATELVDTDVNFVSLVTRGANRIPFRITKEDEQMLDLHKIARSLFKTADPSPRSSRLSPRRAPTRTRCSR